MASGTRFSTRQNGSPRESVTRMRPLQVVARPDWGSSVRKSHLERRTAFRSHVDKSKQDGATQQALGFITRHCSLMDCPTTADVKEDWLVPGMSVPRHRHHGRRGAALVLGPEANQRKSQATVQTPLSLSCSLCCSRSTQDRGHQSRVSH